MSWKTISREIAFECPYFIIFHDKVLTHKDKILDYFVFHIPDSVMIILTTNDHKLLLVKQYRYTVNKVVYELPGGRTDGVQPRIAAKRELKEEVGAWAKKLKKIGTFIAYNGVSREICHLFMASGVTFKEQELEDSEEMDIVRVPLKNIPKWIKTGRIQDGCTLAALNILMQKHSSLFDSRAI